MRTGIDLSFRFGPQRASASPVEEDTVLRVGILGDFSGRSGRGLADPPTRLLDRRWLRLSIDTFDEVLAACAPEVILASGAPGVEALAFAALDDFHPEGLLVRLPRLARLLDLRSRLRSPDTFAQAAMELGCTASTAAAADQEAVPAAPASGQALLASLLGRGDPSTTPKPPVPTQSAGGTGSLVDGLVRAAVGSSATPAMGGEFPACLAHAEMQIAEALRGILHHPGFQAVESLWRGLELLVRRLPEERAVELYLLDLSQAELVADLSQAEDPARCATATLLTDGIGRQLGDGTWQFLVGCYSFGASVEDVDTLGAMGQIAAALGCPWIAAALPALLGCQTAAELSSPTQWSPPSREAAAAWAGLRGSAGAAFLALACPRFLARLPYGPDTDPVASLGFSEVLDARDHERFLWANPAFLVALALTDALATGSAWDGQRVVDASVGDLPMVVVRGGAETQVVPAGELWLPDRAVEAMVARGVTPVQPVRGQDGIRLRMCALGSP
jgi:hypothetical protein